jgi:hypothetical protein
MSSLVSMILKYSCYVVVTAGIVFRINLVIFMFFFSFPYAFWFLVSVDLILQNYCIFLIGLSFQFTCFIICRQTNFKERENRCIINVEFLGLFLCYIAYIC